MAKITCEQISDKIKGITYTRIPGTTATICNITLENGYSVRGESACVDPAEFDAAKGREYAYNNAYDKIWALEGYLLKELLYRKEVMAMVKQYVPGSFSFALQAVLEGKQAARAGWNARGQWICMSGEIGGMLVPSAKLWAPHNQAFADGNGGVARVMPCITLKNAQDQIVMGWAPSQGDLFATDWYILA